MTKYFFRWLWLLTFLSIISTLVHSQSIQKRSIKIVDSHSIPIENYDLQISELLYIEPVGEDFLITHRNKNGISVMNKQGERIRRLGRNGRGPFEWRDPSFVQVNKNEIHIWDAGNLKFIVYDHRFDTLHEIRGLKKSISGFYKNERGQLASYIQPGGTNEFVHMYKMNSDGDYEIEKTIGSITEEGRKFLFMEMIGGVRWNKEDLLWIDPAVSKLFIHNTTSSTTKEVNIDDELFSVEEWTSPSEFSGNTMKELEDYFFSNSRIVSIQKVNDHILLEVEHFPNDKPVINYHVFDLEYNYIDQVNAGDGGWMNYIRGVNGNQLYYWGDDYFETGLNKSIKVRELVFE